MFRRVVALLALFVAGLFVQGPCGSASPSQIIPATGYLAGEGHRSRAQSNTSHWTRISLADAPTLGAVTIAAVDSVSPVHVEVSENGRLIASGDGRFITVRSDSGFVSLRVHVSDPLLFLERL